MAGDSIQPLGVLFEGSTGSFIGDPRIHGCCDWAGVIEYLADHLQPDPAGRQPGADRPPQIVESDVTERSARSDAFPWLLDIQWPAGTLPREHVLVMECTR